MNRQDEDGDREKDRNKGGDRERIGIKKCSHSISDGNIKRIQRNEKRNMKKGKWQLTKRIGID